MFLLRKARGACDLRFANGLLQDDIGAPLSEKAIAHLIANPHARRRKVFYGIADIGLGKGRVDLFLKSATMLIAPRRRVTTMKSPAPA